MIWDVCFLSLCRYQIPKHHYSLAVIIPKQQQDPNTLYKVLEGDKPEDVNNSVSDNKVYEGTRMIFSVPIKRDHAERLVLQKLSSLVNYEDDFLLIYSYLSPCSTCTDRQSKFNILKLIKWDVDYWRDGAFVFTKVFDKPKSEPNFIEREQIIHSLYEVGCSMGGLKYIFRCKGLSTPQLVCHSCDQRFRASELCITN